MRKPMPVERDLRARRISRPLREAMPRAPDRVYYRNLRREAERFRVDLPKKKWCDFWHHHVDWFGFGDRGWLHRRQHLNCLLRALRNARSELAEADQPYQLFATVHPRSSADDAVYVHTANPNGTPFPADLDGGELLDWLPPLLAGRLDLDRYTVRRIHWEGGTHYEIQPRPTG